MKLVGVFVVHDLASRVAMRHAVCGCIAILVHNDERRRCFVFTNKRSELSNNFWGTSSKQIVTS
jgi:hypothetical protein